jgi:membrane associated rhomboid family serine protease
MAFEDRAYNREDQGGPGTRVVFGSPTPLAGILIGACVVVYLFQRGVFGFGDEAVNYYGYFTFAHGWAFTQPWRWFTYQYMHGDFGHLFWNCLSIYFMVPMLQQMWGWKRVFAFYTLGGFAACVTFGVLCAILGSQGALVGASGAFMAVLGAIAYVAPRMQVMAMMMIPMGMRGLALLYAVVYSLTVIADKNRSDAAHLGGLAFGWFAPMLAAKLGVGSQTFAKMSDKARAARVERGRRRDEEEQLAVDRILQKVHTSGMNSLTRGERKTLKVATERQRQADLKRASRAR